VGPRASVVCLGLSGVLAVTVLAAGPVAASNSGGTAVPPLRYTLSPSSGPIGSTVSVTGVGCDDSDFWSGRDGALAFYNNVNGNFSGALQVAFDARPDADGSFSFTFTVPRTGVLEHGSGRFDVLDPLPPGVYLIDLSCQSDTDFDTTFTVTAGPAPQARTIDRSCPAGRVPANPFADVVTGSTHERAISCLVWWQVANGRTPTSFAPAAGVTRDAMASFVARTVSAARPGSLPADPPDAFGDDGGSVHQRAIDQLAAVGIVSGTGGGSYTPGAVVNRGQMARFLANASRHVLDRPLPAGQDLFRDDDTSPFQADINRVAQAGLTGGLPDGTYDPAGPVSRAQMGSFLARTLDLFVENGARLPS
jgi:hypothetical protein